MGRWPVPRTNFVGKEQKSDRSVAIEINPRGEGLEQRQSKVLTKQIRKGTRNHALVLTVRWIALGVEAVSWRKATVGAIVTKLLLCCGCFVRLGIYLCASARDYIV